MQISPSVLTNSKEEYDILMEKIVGVSRVHIDFIDGEFADNTTLAPSEVDISAYPDLIFDAHLQVNKENLEIWLGEVLDANYSRVIVQIEVLDDLPSYVKRVHDKEKQVGIAIDLETEIPHADDLHGVDVVLVMSVKAGFGGQEFDSRALNKIKALSDIRDAQSLDFSIYVDGGVSKDNIKEIVEAGADEVTIGRRLFKGNMQDNIDELMEVANNG